MNLWDTNYKVLGSKPLQNTLSMATTSWLRSNLSTPWTLLTVLSVKTPKTKLTKESKIYLDLVYSSKLETTTGGSMTCTWLQNPETSQKFLEIKNSTTPYSCKTTKLVSGKTPITGTKHSILVLCLSHHAPSRWYGSSAYTQLTWAWNSQLDSAECSDSSHPELSSSSITDLSRLVSRSNQTILLSEDTEFLTWVALRHNLRGTLTSTNKTPLLTMLQLKLLQEQNDV